MQQVHAVLAEPQFLNAFHAESVTAHSMHVEPWVPPVFTSASGFTKARRVAYTMHCDGPGWFTDLTGAHASNLVPLPCEAACPCLIPLVSKAAHACPVHTLLQPCRQPAQQFAGHFQTPLLSVEIGCYSARWFSQSHIGI